MGRFIIAVLVLALAIAAMGLVVPANAAAWNSFTYADLHGIDAVQILQSDGSVVYGLSFIPTATISLDGNLCQINWIQGFYLRTDESSDRFAASDAGATDWKWEQKPPSETTFNLVGWHGTGANRLYAGQPAKMLTFASLDTEGVPVSSGFHIGYTFNGSEESGFFYGHTAPEPSALQAGALFLAGLGGLARYRRNRG